MMKTVPRGRSYAPIAVTLVVAVISLLALLFVNPGPLKRSVVKSPEVVPSAGTAAAAKAAAAHADRSKAGNRAHAPWAEAGAARRA